MTKPLQQMSLGATTLLLALGAFAVVALPSHAATPENILTQYPDGITELGGCNSKEACRQYCAVEENRDACLDFAQSHQLVDQERANAIRSARKSIKAEGGPGGCDSAKSCREYCQENGETCDNYLEENNLVSKERVERIKQRRLSRNNPDDKSFEPIANLGGCDSREACKAFCSQQENKTTCIQYAEDNNLLPAQAADRAKMILAGKGPGGCNSANSCKQYCEENAEECQSFMEEHKFGSEEYRARLKKVKESVQNSVTEKMMGLEMRCRLEENKDKDECIRLLKAKETGRNTDDERSELKRLKDAQIQREALEQKPLLRRRINETSDSQPTE